MMKKPSTKSAAAALGRFLGQLKADRNGNVLMIMGFAIVPLTFVAGFGVDYGRAMRLQTQLNAAADAAALAAVSPAMIFQSNSASTAAATNMFNAQAARLSGYQDLNMTPTVTEGTSSGLGGLGFLRKATISYTVKSSNYFGGILGADTLTVSGSATASAAQPPNVDFYLAMDNSPSMLLPATSDGVSKIIAATKSTNLPDGCAFACHAQMPRTDRIYIKDTDGRDVLLSTSYYTPGSSKEDAYYRWNSSTNTLYDSSGDSMNTSSTSVHGPVTTTSGSGNNKKRIDTTVSTLTATSYSVTDNNNGPATITKTVASTPTTTTVTTVIKTGKVSTSTSTGSTSTSNTQFDTGYWADGYWLTHNYGKIYGSPSSIVLRKDDVVSAASQLIPFASDQASQYHVTYRMQMFSFDWTRSGQSSPVRQLTGLTDVSTYNSSFSVASQFPADDYWWKNSMPTSSINNNDRATEVLNMLTSMKNIMPNAGSGAPGATPQKIFFMITDGMIDQPNGSGRYFGPLRSTELDQCTAIKAKGIKIAILYTQYLPESLIGDSWSQSNVAPFLPPPGSPYPAGNSGSSDKVLTALERCSSPGTNGGPLVQTVTSDDNITAALQELFSTALQAARLVQ